MFAQIINGRVAALTETPAPLSPLVEVFDWDVQVGWLFEGGQCVPPPEPNPYPMEPEYLDLGAISISQAERLYAAAQAEALTASKDGPATVLLEMLEL